MSDQHDLDIFPTLTLTFVGGCKFTVSPHFYMFSPVNHVYCMGVYSDPSTVIGNNILQGHNAVFDLEKRQFGIAKANISFIYY